MFIDCPVTILRYSHLPFTSLTGDTVRDQAAPILWVVSALGTWKLSGRSCAGRAVVASWTFILQKGRGIFGTEEPGWKTEEKGQWREEIQQCSIHKYPNNDLMVVTANLMWLLHWPQKKLSCTLPHSYLFPHTPNWRHNCKSHGDIIFLTWVITHPGCESSACNS